MKVITKQFVLTNGKQVKVVFVQLPEQYSIYAEDSSNKIVGKLCFQIMKVFSRDLSPSEKQQLAINQGLSAQSMKDKLTFVITQDNEQYYDIKNNTLFYEGVQCKLANTYTVLNSIEVLYEDYFKVGLGSAMHDIMEKFARSKGCSQIRLGLYRPYGQFASGTRAFYENHGYTFDYIGGQKVVYKDLLSKNTTKHHQNPSGTPINSKYLT